MVGHRLPGVGYRDGGCGLWLVQAALLGVDPGAVHFRGQWRWRCCSCVLRGSHRRSGGGIHCGGLVGVRAAQGGTGGIHRATGGVADGGMAPIITFHCFFIPGGTLLNAKRGAGHAAEPKGRRDAGCIPFLNLGMNRSLYARDVPENRPCIQPLLAGLCGPCAIVRVDAGRLPYRPARGR